MKTTFCNQLSIILETCVACTKTCAKAETWYQNTSCQITQELILNLTSGKQNFSILIAIKNSMFLLQIFSVDLNQNNSKHPKILVI